MRLCCLVSPAIECRLCGLTTCFPCWQDKVRVAMAVGTDGQLVQVGIGDGCPKSRAEVKIHKINLLDGSKAPASVRDQYNKRPRFKTRRYLV